VLRLSPDWAHWTYRLLLAIFIASLTFLYVGRMSEYATGPAVVRAKYKSVVTSPVSATVQRVVVAPGERVKTGHLLVQLEDAEELANVRRYEQELEAQLSKSLRDPLDETARQNAASLQSQLAYAKQRLAARRLIAPSGGIVSDVRIRAGQALEPGQHVATLLGPDSRLSLIIMLPGFFRPQLSIGQPALFEINGYPQSYQSVTLDKIADEVVGPTEVRRYLGQEIADAIPVSGSVVLAEAQLDTPKFIADGHAYNYADGLQGRVQVRVRSVPIILHLVPGLRSLWKGSNNSLAQ
jgi:membrane fusion protein (multidrug efflux system)